MKHVLPAAIHTWKHNSLSNDPTIDELISIQPKTVYDVGCGDGFYGKLVKLFLKDATVIGIEKCTDYVSKWHLETIYDLIINADIIDVASTITGDLIIFGDVLEHVEKQHVKEILDAVVPNFKYIIINSPLGFQPQPHEVPSEIHRCGLDKTDFEKYNIVSFDVYDKITFNCLIRGLK